MAVVKCAKCEKTFTLQKNLNRHLKNVHKSEPAPICFAENCRKYLCMHCKCSYRQNKDLLYHLSSEHDFQLETETVRFQSLSEFLDWKCNVKKEEKCDYVIARGKAKNRNGEIVQKYICNRTGMASRNNKNIKFKRQLKSQGSCKLNRACISEIKMVKDADEKVSVTRIKSHYGHNAEIQHTRISKQERASIATKLMNGASKIKILDIYRMDIGDQLKRINLLTKKDINNIQRSFKLDITEGRKHENAVSVISQEINDCVSSIGNAQKTSGLKEEIRLRLSNINSNLDNKSDAVLAQLNCLLKTGVALLNTEKGNQQIVETTPSNVEKNILPQNRFRSTRKKRIPIKKRFKKPDAEEVDALVDTSINMPTLIISNNSALDHSYLN